MTCTARLNTVAEGPGAVDHTPVAGASGSIHAVGLPAGSGSARTVASVVHAVVGTIFGTRPVRHEQEITL